MSPVCPQVNNQTFALYLRDEGYTVPVCVGRVFWGGSSVRGKDSCHGLVAGWQVGMFGKYLNNNPRTPPPGIDAYMTNGGGACA